MKRDVPQVPELYRCMFAVRLDLKMHTVETKYALLHSTWIENTSYITDSWHLWQRSYNCPGRSEDVLLLNNVLTSARLSVRGIFRHTSTREAVNTANFSIKECTEHSRHLWCLLRSANKAFCPPASYFQTLKELSILVGLIWNLTWHLMVKNLTLIELDPLPYVISGLPH